MTVLATPLPDTVPSSRPATVTARPGPAPPPDLPTAASDHSRKNLPGARCAEDRAVDGEQDDVARRHVERHAEDALERHVDRADDAREVVAAMRDHAEADEIEQRPVEGVEDEAGRGERQHPSRRAARRLEHEQDADRAECHVARRSDRPRGR